MAIAMAKCFGVNRRWRNVQVQRELPKIATCKKLVYLWLQFLDSNFKAGNLTYLFMVQLQMIDLQIGFRSCVARAQFHEC